MLSEYLSADVASPARAREYRELMDIIHRRGEHGRDRYGSLMDKEERVLDTVDRVVNDARLQDFRHSSFLDMTVVQIIGKTAEVVHDMYVETLSARSMSDARDVLVRPERRIYIGIVVLAVGFFLGFIQMIASSPSSSATPLLPSPSFYRHSTW